MRRLSFQRKRPSLTTVTIASSSADLCLSITARSWARPVKSDSGRSPCRRVLQNGCAIRGNSSPLRLQPASRRCDQRSGNSFRCKTTRSYERLIVSSSDTWEHRSHGLAEIELQITDEKQDTSY